MLGFWIIVILVFLFVGSFISMLVYRYPRMLLKDWQTQSQDFLKEHPTPIEPSFNLALPRSFCPNCQHTIAWYDNVPLLGFLWQRGRCRHCQHPISWRYFLTECLCLGSSLVVMALFGWQWSTVAALGFTWILLALSLIDIDHQFLPDPLNLGLLWLGLGINSVGLFCPLTQAIWGAIVGYSSLWLVMTLYQRITKKVGMGHGDFKLFAALGAWMGIGNLLPIILLASLTGTVLSLLWLAKKRMQYSDPIPFGPFLAVAGWVVFILWHTQLYSLYKLI